MAHLSTIFASSLFFCIISTATAHSNLGKPLAYNRQSCKASASWCKGACPPTWRNGGNRNSPSKPAATWKRGQRVEIIWHKNNHIGGFYRRSLVPIKHMYKEEWHKKTAFNFGCWGQGTFQCGKNDVCGADLKGRAYKNSIVIPDVFPDGTYVFGQVWYGGLYWRGTRPKYSDYYACSYIRIKGGNPLKAEATATWTGSKTTCRTGSTRPLQCGGESCEKNPVISAVPDEFMGGKKPKVYLKTLDTEMKFTDIKATSDVGLNEAMQDMKAAEIADTKMGKEEAQAEVAVAVEQKETPVTKSTTTSSVLKSVNVYVDYKFSKAVYDGEDAVIDTEGKDVSIEVFTAGKKVGTVSMLINGKVRWRDSRGPYVFQGNRGKDYNKWKNPILNKKFTFGAFIRQNGKTTSISVGLTLTK